MLTKKKIEWGRKATDKFKGKVVERIEYMTDSKVESFLWGAAAPIIIFTDGSWLLPSSDDEGNGAGSLFTSETSLPIIPVIKQEG